MEGTIDEVIVKVTGKVDKSSTDNINSLAESLGKLKQSVKGGYHNLNKLANALQELKTNATGLAQLNKSLSAVQGIADALKPLETITSPKGLTKTIKNLERLPEVIAKITPDTLQNVARVANELSVALTPLANKFADIAVGFSSLQALADKYGVSVTKITERTNKTINKMTLLKKVVEAVKSPFAKLSNSFNSFGKGAHRGFDKLISKTKQLGLSLLGTRSIFTATRKAISEYMQMDEELTKATTNLWRALGAQLAPAVEFVLYLFKQFTRAVYSFVYAITGVDLIARANAKAMAGWGKSAKDTLGNLQKFDDLNVADFGKGSGDNALIELDKIDLSPIQWIIDATIRIKNAFKEAFNTGQWKGVGKELANLANDFTSRFTPEKILGGITKLGGNISDVINGWFENIDATGVGKVFQTAILAIPTLINTMLDKIDWALIGTKIREAILSIDWGEIFNTIIELGKNILSSGGTLLDNVFDTTIFTQLADTINNIVDNISLIGTTISDTLGEGSVGGNIIANIETMFSNILSLVDSIGKFLTNWIISEEFQNIVSILSNSFNDILGFINDIIKDFTDWFNGEGGQILQSILNKLTAILGDCLEIIVEVVKEIGRIVVWAWNTLIKPVIDPVLKLIDWLLTLLKDIASFIKHVLVGDWKSAFEDIGKFATDLWEGIKTGFKNLINGVIEKFESFINKIIHAINWIINKYNGSLGDFFDWLGFEAKITPISDVSIPRLATGTNEVPYEGLFHLHQGEAVVPKKYNPAVGGGYTGELDEKIDKLITIVENMDTTTTVNVGNKTLYEEQRRYNNFQRNKYGSIKV